MIIKNRQAKKAIRHRRIRTKIIGTKERPRLSVFKSNKHFFIQLIDDGIGNTLLSVSDKEISAKGGSASGGKESKDGKAYKLGKFIAKKAGGLGIKKIVFDRSGYKFHGLTKNVALGVREGGLEF